MNSNKTDSTVSQMVALCGQAVPLWDIQRKGYSPESELRAAKLSTELNELRYVPRRSTR